MRRTISALTVALLAGRAAASDIVVSSATVPGRPAPLEYRIGYDKPRASRDSRASIGVGRVLSEGPVLEVGLWGSGGAVVGSLAGPAGTVIGAAVGAVAGMIVSAFMTPSDKKARRT